MSASLSERRGKNETGSVVTGVGAQIGHADNLSQFEDLLFGTETAQSLTESPLPVGFEFATASVRKGLKRMDPCTRLGLTLVDMALCDAKLDESLRARANLTCGLVVSCNLGVIETVVRVCRKLRSEGSRMLSPLDLSKASPNVVAGQVAIEFGLRGPSLSLSGGWGGGLDAIVQGDLLIRSGRADVVVVVGVEDLRGMAGEWIRTWAGCGDIPLGSGGAAIVIESERVASQRGARIRAEIRGHSSAQVCAGIESCTVARVVRDAETHLERGDYLLFVNDPGPGDARRIEMEALLQTAKPDCVRPRTALKSRLGESYGASGVLQCAAAVLCIDSQRAFATPHSWQGPSALEAVAPTVVKCRAQRLDGTLLLAGAPGEMWTALTLGCPQCAQNFR